MANFELRKVRVASSERTGATAWQTTFAGKEYDESKMEMVVHPSLLRLQSPGEMPLY